MMMMMEECARSLTSVNQLQTLGSAEINAEILYCLKQTRILEESVKQTQILCW